MSFFLPSRLADFEYFGSEPDLEYEKLAKPYRKDIDFAFFVVNFGYSKRDYESLTLREKVFIYKAWENKMITDTTNIYNAIYTSTYNVNKPKRKKALSLWKKKAIKKADMVTVQNNLALVKEVEKKEGKNWIELVYKNKGINKNKEVK